jgi:transforming growth factor-beta-induced protein
MRGRSIPGASDDRRASGDLGHLEQGLSLLNRCGALIFSMLVSAVVIANLQGPLSGAGPFTVFAPTNDAFTAIQTTVAGLSTAQLTKVLTYHVLPAPVLAANIPFGTPVATVEGATININAGTPPTITDKAATTAPIVATDSRASNVVIHVISKVLIPTP